MTRHDGRVILEPAACFSNLWATSLAEVTDDLAALERGGRWAVAIPYSGAPVLARFAEWTIRESSDGVGTWSGPSVDSWSTSMDAPSYKAAVDDVRDAIAAGTVYQVNVCRVMEAELPPGEHDIAVLHRLLAAGNPAPFGGFLRLPEQQVAIASASPELFLSVQPQERGRVVTSGPIKGTGVTAADLADKDRAENVMIVDLVRNDLARVTVPGSVTVPALLRVEEHPGLVHLVSRVEGLLEPRTSWADLLQATFPPGSVTGAPKSSALRVIDAVEPVPREYYCGAFGWIDADTGEAELAVAIRTFWVTGSTLRFGTGAGITWASDPRAEWQETELKARRLISLASRAWQGDAL